MQIAGADAEEHFEVICVGDALLFLYNSDDLHVLALRLGVVRIVIASKLRYDVQCFVAFANLDEPAR